MERDKLEKELSWYLGDKDEILKEFDLISETLEVMEQSAKEVVRLRAENDRFRAQLSDITGLCIGYDGFDTVEGLKSLIDDITRVCKEGPLTEISIRAAEEVR